MASDNGLPVATSAEKRLFWLVALPILLIDQATKWWIVQNMPLNTVYAPVEALLPFFKFTHVANTGAVFGILRNAGAPLAILAIVVSGALIFYNTILPGGTNKLRITLGMVLAGALGNMIDRFTVGHVTDFMDIDLSSLIPLQIADWYIFNVADMAIVGAIIALIYLSIFEPEQIEPQPAASESADG